MWAFPRARPQVFAESRRSLAVAARYYAFARRQPAWRQSWAARSLALPLAGRPLAVPVPFRPPCGWRTWPQLEAAVNPPSPGRWAYFVPTWRDERFGAFPIERRGEVRRFVMAGRTSAFHPAAASGGAFRVPRILAAAEAAGWQLREIEAMPPLHRAPRLDRHRLAAVVESVRLTLAPELARGHDVPAGWVPIHGDLTPWNLREARDGALWLVDWEAAGWGPPGADEMHYLVAEASLRTGTADELSIAVERSLGGPDGEAAAFWLAHPAFAAAVPDAGHEAGRRADVARRELVIGALRRMARG